MDFQMAFPIAAHRAVLGGRQARGPVSVWGSPLSNLEADSKPCRQLVSTQAIWETSNLTKMK